MFLAVTGPIAGAVVGGLMNSGSGGGGGASQTQSKEPWAPAVPWITSNLQTGQNLQNYYQDNPFNAVQQASYGNLFRGNDYINSMVPGLLSQFSQSQGFDRNNPRARPQAMQFPVASMVGYQPVGGLLGSAQGGMNGGANPFANGLMPSAPAASAAAAPSAPSYMDWVRSLGGSGV